MLYFDPGFARRTHVQVCIRLFARAQGFIALQSLDKNRRGTQKRIQVILKIIFKRKSFLHV